MATCFETLLLALLKGTLIERVYIPKGPPNPITPERGVLIRALRALKVEPYWDPKPYRVLEYNYHLEGLRGSPSSKLPGKCRRGVEKPWSFEAGRSFTR